MTMKLRAVIMRPEHTNDIFLVTKKMMVTEKLFKRGDCAYELDNKDHFQITHDRPWWCLWIFKRYFTTYYYALGHPKPLPVPNFTIDKVEQGLVEGEELANMFEAWLWRTIASPVRDAWEQMQFYIQVGTLLGVAYLVWDAYHGGHQAAATAGGAASASTPSLPPPGP